MASAFLARPMTALLLAGSLGIGLSAGAAGYTDYGQDLVPRERPEVSLSGYMRVRGEALHNLDLDRGLTPSGLPLYPVPLGDARAQTLTHANARLRSDVAVYAPGQTVALKLRVDVLDNFALGSRPVFDGGGASATPAASAGQAPIDTLRIRRAYGEALTPVGLLAAGRMGAHWGLGLLTHGGDCDDCDGGDAADRIAFISPLAGHLLAASYDFSAVGPQTTRRSGRVVDLDPADDVRSVSFAVLNWRGPETRARRAAADKATFEYGLLFSHRWQDRDVPAHWLPSGTGALDASQVMRRGYRASVVDLWARLGGPRFRVEAELAAVRADVEQASLVPGVELRAPVSATQFGGAVESELLFSEGRVRVGLDTGFASGDPAPGFGAYPGSAPGTTGDLDGAQAQFPYDTQVDNFRFHPDYRVDRILFREVIGTVTDAVWLKPHAHWDLLDLPTSRVTVGVAAVASRALHASSTPGGAAPLGLELDPSVSWTSRDGFRAALDYAVLFPFSGLDNAATSERARPAQLLRLRLLYAY